MITSEFETLLEKAFQTWNRSTFPNPGLLKIEMTGSGFLDWLNEEKAAEVIELMKKRFPEDAAFYELPGRSRVKHDQGNGNGSDLYFVIFATQEWEPVKEGETLPTICIDGWLPE